MSIAPLSPPEPRVHDDDTAYTERWFIVLVTSQPGEYDPTDAIGVVNDDGQLQLCTEHEANEIAEAWNRDTRDASAAATVVEVLHYDRCPVHTCHGETG